jgi:tRNA pseudouridine55 synthase
VNGLLVIDKPAGLTSHDVVARVRRLLRERSVGHTGTLDPSATGVLPLVLGRATRLARFLSASDKTYEAVVTLGVATDTADASGAPLGAPYPGPLPSRDDIARALDAFRGPFIQEPPAYSAKKIGGKRSYKLARAASAAAASRHLRPTPEEPPPSQPEPYLHPGSEGLPPSQLRPASVPVVVHRLDVIHVEGNRVTLRLECSAGFYVRSLAHDLGTALGTGAHVSALRRTRSGEWALADAIALDTAEREPEQAIRHVIPLARMLADFPPAILTAEGLRRVTHGRDVGLSDCEKGGRPLFSSPFFRLLDPAGELVGIAQPAATSGFLHPFVVLV